MPRNTRMTPVKEVIGTDMNVKENAELNCLSKIIKQEYCTQSNEERDEIRRLAISNILKPKSVSTSELYVP